MCHHMHSHIGRTCINIYYFLTFLFSDVKNHHSLHGKHKFISVIVSSDVGSMLKSF